MAINVVRLIRNAARALVVIWAGFWVFFAGSHLFEIGPEPVQWDGVAAVIGFILFFSASAVIPWKWELLGGALLVLEGLAEAIVYPNLGNKMSNTVVIQMFFMMGLPPLLSGILFLIHQRLIRIPKHVG
jgi:hypothetical protein